ncbi:unnamed protein product [Cochlearia groenlandica]
MECNKDEAERAKEIAEKKFKIKDIAGAKKFALKAQSLYPEIEGVSQMLATFDVYAAAAENKVNEDLDWYGILNANPRDDNETLKRKYRKLALTLHPDKNSSIGAEGAFKHVSEAWKFLSDKDKRAAYDRKKSLQAVYQKVSVSVPSSNNGFTNFAKTSFTSNARTTAQKCNPPPTTTTHKSNPQKPVSNNTQKTGHTTHPSSCPPASGSSSDKTKSDTFWTVCRRCMIQYEYLRVYAHRNIMCPNCLQSFSSAEVPKPGMSSHWTSFSRLKRNLDPKSAANHNGLFNNSKWTFSRTSSAAHAASVVQQAYEKVKKEREEAKATAGRDKKKAKRKNTNDSSSTSGKKRKVIGETETDCSSGRKVTYHIITTGETGINTGKLHGITERADKLSPGIRRKISKESVAREIKAQ